MKKIESLIAYIFLLLIPIFETRSKPSKQILLLKLYSVVTSQIS